MKAIHATTNRHARRWGTNAASERAFTLFEVVLVILIISLIAAISIAQFRGQSSLRLATAANVLAADIEFCEDQCITNPNNLYTVQFNFKNNLYWIALASSTSVPVSDPVDSRPYQNDFQTGRNARLAGVSLSAISMGSGATALTPDVYGCPNLQQNGTVTLTDGFSTVTVTIDANTGDVTIGSITALPGH